MKSIALAVTLLCLVGIASASFAANPVLTLPRGLAVDTKGNLWVANPGSNNILAYNLVTYAQEPVKTITTGILNPWGVAVDRWGHVWVSNQGTNFVPGTVTEYAIGQKNPIDTLNEIASPQAIAFDPVGDLWVQTNFPLATPNFKVYTPQSGEPFGTPANLGTTITPGGTLYGLAFGATGVMIGAPTDAFVSSTGPGLILGESPAPSRFRTAPALPSPATAPASSTLPTSMARCKSSRCRRIQTEMER